MNKSNHLYKSQNGFAVVVVIVVVVVVVILIWLFWPSPVPKGAPVPFPTITTKTTVTGTFKMVPKTLGTQSSIVKFSLTTGTGAGLNGKVVRFKLSNTVASQFTSKSKSRVKKGVASIAIRAKKRLTGDGTISATVILKTANGNVQAIEVSTNFEIDGTTGPSTY